MGLLDFFKNRKNRKLMLAPTMTGRRPSYSSFSDSLYAFDIVMQSIRCKANEFKKLDPRHVRTTNGAQSVISDSSIAQVLRRPNEYMTQAEFLEKITVLLELNKNVFIYPTYYVTKGGEKYYTGLYPLKPTETSYMVDEAGRYFVNLRFANGYETTVPRDEIIHWRKDYGANEYFGGNAYGAGSNTELLRTLQAYDQLCESIARAVDCSCKVNGIVEYNSYMSDDKLSTEQAEFNKRLENNEGGILFTDLKLKYTPLDRDIKVVDAETLKFFYQTITRANGTSLAILDGDYTKSQKEAYYEHALEADIKALGQAISMVVFSKREASFGNEIILYPNDITFMSMENKIAYMQVAVPAGALSVNQILAMGGFPPIEGGDTIRPRGYNELDSTQTGGATNAEE